MPCEKIGFDICLLLEANSAYRVQNPFQNITLHGYGTGAALRGWPVYWVPEKFLTTPHRECRHSPYLFLIFLFCHSHPSHLSLSREEEDFFEVSTQAKNYTCQRHDFGFDDFVMESRFGRRFFCECSFYTLDTCTDARAIFCIDVKSYAQLYYDGIADIFHILHCLIKCTKPYFSERIL